MAVIEPIARLQEEMTRWRRDIHAQPEVGFEEKEGSLLVLACAAGFLLLEDTREGMLRKLDSRQTRRNDDR